REAKAASALHHRGAALDLDRFIDELATIFAIFGCHVYPRSQAPAWERMFPRLCLVFESARRSLALVVPGRTLGPSGYCAVAGGSLGPSLFLKTQSCFTGCIRQRRDATVILVVAAVERDDF